jgi:hypothetical protein
MRAASVRDNSNGNKKKRMKKQSSGAEGSEKKEEEEETSLWSESLRYNLSNIKRRRLFITRCEEVTTWLMKE